MPRLFVAVDLPELVTAELVAVQPQAAPGIRLTDPAQMHLTLHYIGEVNEDRAGRMAAALAVVDVPTFPMTIEGVGQFPSAGGTTTLWAGVADSVTLRHLHAAVGRALAGEGFQPEARRYTPHVSLARCAPEVPESVVSAFLTSRQGLRLSGVVMRFALYSSVFRGDVPFYRCEKVFPLRLPVVQAE